MIIGIDTGGTFTDFFWSDPENDEGLQVLKEPSTPDNPSEAIVHGLKRIAVEFDTIVHGTTVATNAVLERKGARVILLTTRGFEDVLEIGRQTRQDIYNLDGDRPAPLVPHRRRIGITERVDKNGKILTPLRLDEEIVEQLRDGQPESIAVCYLFSWVNPEHEQKTRQLIEGENIQAYWSLSSDLIPEYREYERTSTTVLNAFVTPVIDRYLRELEANLSVPRLRVMQSNGGSMNAGAARKEAIQTLLSGPAGGVVATDAIAKLCGVSDAISFDMGGTSSDVAFLPGGIPMTDESSIDGLPVKLPMVNIHTVGSGGGSVAYLDNAGVLQVGPESAGAVPGPVCYDQGGTQLTVSDANLLLGRLPGKVVFGEDIQINLKHTTEIAKQFAAPLGISAKVLAESIIAIANARMERAIRVISVEQGYDPGDAALFAFGGAGPLHGCAIAESFGIPLVIVPNHAGVFSAFGLLRADVTRNKSKTFLQKQPDIHWEWVRDELQTLEKSVRKDILSQGISDENIVCDWSLKMRYHGQSYEIEIPWQQDMLEAFHQRHAARYTFRDDEREVEIVNLRVLGVGQVEKPEIQAFPVKPQQFPLTDLPKQQGQFRNDIIELSYANRSDLQPGHYGEGPLVVSEKTATTFIPPDWKFSVDAYRNLHLEQV